MKATEKYSEIVEKIVKATQDGATAEELMPLLHESLAITQNALAELEEAQAKKHAYVETLEAKNAALQAENTQLRHILEAMGKGGGTVIN